MPKLKTHKGAKYRFHITGTGKIMRMKAHRSHIRRTKPPRVLRSFHMKHEVSPSDAHRIRKVLPYL